MQVEKREWKEKRGDGWSETDYAGLLVKIDGKNYLISKLSHGLRVIPMKEDGYYKWTGSPNEKVEVSEEFMRKAMLALQADMAFQSCLPEYLSVMKLPTQAVPASGGFCLFYAVI